MRCSLFHSQQLIDNGLIELARTNYDAFHGGRIIIEKQPINCIQPINLKEPLQSIAYAISA